MTRKEALAALIDAVYAGDNVSFRAANRAVFSTPCQDMNLQLREENCRHAYKGSLDAALSLHQSVLPSARVHDLSQFERGWACVLNGDIPPHFFYGDADTPARAWLLAILKALHEMETEQ